MAAAQIIDNFENGLSSEWIQSYPGRWMSDTSGSLQGKKSLHHIFDNPESGIDRIGIPVSDLHADEGTTRWSFLVRHGYDPSSSNNWAIFLMSSSPPSEMTTEGTVKGYAIGVNLIGYDDTLRLWKLSGTSIIPVVNSRINWQTDIGGSAFASIEVERNESGRWNVKVLKNNAISLKSSEGFDNEINNTSWFGIFYRYSSTRDRLLWIDDISVSGVFYRDTIPPSVTGSTASGRNRIKLTLDEKPDSNFMKIENFYLNSPDNNPSAISALDDLTYLLDFDNTFVNKKQNSFVIKTICDKSLNCRSDITFLFTPVWAETGDIIITEIMADPLPSVSLPEAEYLEIMNTSGFRISLGELKLTAGGQSFSLPSCFADAGEILILCAQKDTMLLRPYGRTVGIKQFPSLYDEGRLLALYDTCGTLIHGIDYSEKWYDTELKSHGGWSLEMKDTFYPFYSEGNWTASSSGKGGTPGKTNSVSMANPDKYFRGIANVFPESETLLKISFSEPVKDFNCLKNSKITPEISVTDVVVTDPLFREFLLSLSGPLSTRKVYKLELDNLLIDYAGNSPEIRSFRFGLAEPAGQGDIMFNEVLFNPLPGDPDFIELYNCSAKVIDASSLLLISIDEDSHDTSSVFQVCTVKRSLLPDTYFTITSSKLKTVERYFTSSDDNIYEIPSLPSMPDDEGTLLLLGKDLTMIDKFSYNDEMHSTFLTGHEGISLEKMIKCTPSGTVSGWHSASEVSGSGTPGSPNSVSSETLPGNGDISLSSTKITPDGDGFEDFLQITFANRNPGTVISVSIYDENGSYVRKLAGNMLAGTQTILVWDGTADDRQPLQTGIYIILISWYDETGASEKVKKVCTIIR